MIIILELHVATYQSSIKKTENEFSRRKIVGLLKLNSKIRFKIIENNQPVSDPGCFICSLHSIVYKHGLYEEFTLGECQLSSMSILVKSYRTPISIYLDKAQLGVA